MKRVFRWSRSLSLVFGTSLLVFLFWQFDIRALLVHLTAMGWGILAVLAISILWKVCNTAAWQMTFAPGGNVPGYWHLFRVSLIGDVVSNLLPAAGMGGEVAKPYLLRPQVSMSQGMASVVACKTMEIFSGLLFITLGIGLALFSISFDEIIRWSVLGIWSLGVVLVGAAILIQRRGLLSRVLSLLDRLRISRKTLGIGEGSVTRFEQRLAAFYHQHPGRFWACLGLRLCSWFWGTLETFMLLHLMGAEATYFTAMMLVSLVVVFEAVVFFVPSGIGTFEAGHSYVALLLGVAPEIGLSMALVKRFRRLLWMGAGLALYSWHRIETQSAVPSEHIVQASKL